MRMIFCGDMAFSSNTGVETILDEKLQKLFNSYDFRCVNFECAIHGVKKGKIGPSLVLDEQMWPAINAVGFDLFCLANNHIMDEGIEGLVNLKQKLKNISTVGAGETVEEAYSPFYFSKDNVNVGIVNLAENGFGACTKGGVCVAWTSLC